MRRSLVLIMLFGLVACTGSKKAPKKVKATEPKKEVANYEDFKPKFFIGPSTLVYKTKKDYSTLVPVNLTDDKKEIYSYPHPEDVVTKDGYQTPGILSSGYYLDNRGINENVAFLKLTYEEYAQLKTLPTKQELLSWVVDKDPLIELCDCGNRKVYKDIIAQLNYMIDKKKINTLCKTLK